MSLKPQLDKPPVAGSSPLMWGTLVDSGELANVIRFECEDGTYSYPYHALTRWVWQAGKPERVVIEAGSDRVIVCGRRLKVVRDALDTGRLRVLRMTAERYINTETEAIVTGLTLVSSKTEE